MGGPGLRHEERVGWERKTVEAGTQESSLEQN